MNPTSAQDYSTFRRFYSPEEAAAMASKLDQSEIPSATTRNDESFAQVGAGGNPVVTYDLSIPTALFEKAESLLRAQLHPNTKITTFRRFQVPEQAEETADLLRLHGIFADILDTAPAVDLTLTAGYGPITYDVSIPEKDFQKAEQLMQQRVKGELEAVAPDHYLYDFSDEELREVVFKSDEWSAFDFTLARKILRERGKPINQDEVEAMKQQRLNALAQPEKNTPIWIFIGYGLALVGGFLGIIMGLLIWTMKKTLPNGNRVHTYTESDRRHGRNIFFIGIAMLVVLPILYYFSQMPY